MLTHFLTLCYQHRDEKFKDDNYWLQLAGVADKEETPQTHTKIRWLTQVLFISSYFFFFICLLDKLLFALLADHLIALLN